MWRMQRNRYLSSLPLPVIIKKYLAKKFDTKIFLLLFCIILAYSYFCKQKSTAMLICGGGNTCPDNA